MKNKKILIILETESRKQKTMKKAKDILLYGLPILLLFSIWILYRDPVGITFFSRIISFLIKSH